MTDTVPADSGTKLHLVTCCKVYQVIISLLLNNNVNNCSYYTGYSITGKFVKSAKPRESFRPFGNFHNFIINI